MIVALACLVGITAILIIIGWILSAPKYKGKISDHFNGKQFINPGNVEAKRLKDVFRWLLNRKRTEWIEYSSTEYGERPPAKITSHSRITFINHSTFLIQVDGLNILTDPIWSERASPFKWTGPKRKRSPGIRMDDMPHIDVILLSHNHYDHLDIATLKKLYQQFKPRIYTGLGVGGFLKKAGIDEYVEMDWWEETKLNEKTKIVAVPAQHFSGRGMFDRDATLWLGFVIKNENGNIFFAADTGYNDFTFKEIGKRCAPISISILPIGAYKPRWFMSPIHCAPDQAVKIHLDVKSTISIGSHFGTFALADEGRDEPIAELKNAVKQRNLPEDSFITLEEGKGKDFDL
jgi:L-ascorbate metabolism protein UlaG (beta-lactamase superfamily)